MNDKYDPECFETLDAKSTHPEVSAIGAGNGIDPLATAPQSAGSAIHASSSERSGAYIGPYKILEKIAEGGMGVVYLAEQLEPIRRRVALKVIKSSTDSQEVISRFEAERQALALMDHPNIARVFDGGQAADASPYFAMELVEGIPFTDYCDQHKLTIRDRLALFIPVCKAVQHAHQKGIIHRDLKPHNVLVATCDGIPVPKVIDFGLAKATNHRARLTDKTMFTEYGQVLGTVQYMSPEQAEVTQFDVDTRTDIYSLGVMLYEILIGSTPLDRDTLGQNSLFQILQIIREKDPPRPSIRLRGLQQDATEIAADRQIPPARLQQILHGDLDWIVMKSLEKDRSRRYETANDFAEDLRRFLENEPVLARPPSVMYQITKAVRKHRVGFSTAGVFVATVLLLLGVMTFLYVEAADLANTNKSLVIDRDAKISELDLLNKQQSRLIREKTELVSSESKAKEQAKQKAADQLATTEFLFEIFGAGDPLFSKVISRYGAPANGDASVKEMLIQAVSAELDDQRTAFLDRPGLRAKILGGLTDFTLSCGELATSKKALDRALSLLPETPEYAVDRAMLQVSAALLDFCFGDLQRAEEELNTALPILEQAYLHDPTDRQLERKLSDVPMILGLIFLELDQLEESQTQFEIMGKSLGNEPDDVLRRLAGQLFALGVHRERLSRLAEPTGILNMQIVLLSTQLLRIKDDINENVAEAITSGAKVIMANLQGNSQQGFGELEKILSALENSLGKDHILIAFPLFYIGLELERVDRDQEALEYNTRLLALIDEQIGVRKHPRLRQILSQRGSLLRKIWEDTANGDMNSTLLVEALEATTEAVSIGTQAFGKDHWQVGYAQYQRAKVLRSQGNNELALADLESGLELLVNEFGERHKHSLNSLREMGGVLQDLDKIVEAERVLRQRIDYSNHPSVSRSQLGRTQFDLAMFLWETNQNALDQAKKNELAVLLVACIENLGSDVQANGGALLKAHELCQQLVMLDTNAVEMPPQ